jgi:hypothetical protein
LKCYLTSPISIFYGCPKFPPTTPIGHPVHMQSNLHFHTIVVLPSGRFSVNFTCLHNCRPHFLVCIFVCVRVLVYVTLTTYALNDRAHAHTHTRTDIYANNCTIAISYSLNCHSSVQLQSPARLHSAVCVHGDARCVCVRDKMAYSSGVVVRAVGLP